MSRTEFRRLAAVAHSDITIDATTQAAFSADRYNAATYAQAALIAKARAQRAKRAARTAAAQ